MFPDLIQPPIQWVLEAPSLRIKLEGEDDHYTHLYLLTRLMHGVLHVWNKVHSAS
jgi:hypothetical protein